MTTPSHPLIRPLELVPLGEDREGRYALRDPFSISSTVALTFEAAMLVTMMNGERSHEELRKHLAEKYSGVLTLPEIERVVNQLDEEYFLENDRFEQHKKQVISEYESLEIRPAAHAGAAYPRDEKSIREQLGEFFTCKQGPGLLPTEGGTASDYTSEAVQRLCGVMSPHIDFQRGGPTFAWAYDRIVTESTAKVFVILGTAHTPLQGMYSVSKKHFDTPLGTVATDRDFIDSLSRRMSLLSSAKETAVDFDDEFPHRKEHSIEFQALMLQYILGGQRDFKIVPILVGSFASFVSKNCSPGDSPAVADFVAALRETIGACGSEVCFIAGVDLAHIGQQFGDEQLLEKSRLTEQWTDDQQLLAAACEGDPEAWFIHVAAQQDRNRICGLAPTYTMLEAMRPDRGELLKYDQAVAEDGSSCVSFASAAFYV